MKPSEEIKKKAEDLGCSGHLIDGLLIKVLLEYLDKQYEIYNKD